VLDDERHFTVIFDRGGYDGQLFGWLVEQGLDFITYQRGDVALARDQFPATRCAGKASECAAGWPKTRSRWPVQAPGGASSCAPPAATKRPS